MPQIIYRTLTVLILASLLLIEQQLGLSRAAEIHQSEKNALVLQCANRLDKWFPLLTVQPHELDLDHMKIAVVGGQQVVIPTSSSCNGPGRNVLPARDLGRGNAGSIC